MSIILYTMQFSIVWQNGVDDLELSGIILEFSLARHIGWIRRENFAALTRFCRNSLLENNSSGCRYKHHYIT